jgi:hypothetical protein
VLDEDFSVEPYALVLARGDPDFVSRSTGRSPGCTAAAIEAIFNRWLGPLDAPARC